jgi:hypothetical protein
MAWGNKITGTAFPMLEIETPSQAKWEGPIPLIDQKNLDPSEITLRHLILPEKESPTPRP